MYTLKDLVYEQFSAGEMNANECATIVTQLRLDGNTEQFATLQKAEIRLAYLLQRISKIQVAKQRLDSLLYSDEEL